MVKKGLLKLKKANSSIESLHFADCLR